MSEPTKPARTGRRVTINAAQVMAARIGVRNNRERGEPVPAKLLKIAAARRADGTAVRIGIDSIDQEFLTPDEMVNTPPEISPALQDALQAMVDMIARP